MNTPRHSMKVGDKFYQMRKIMKAHLTFNMADPDFTNEIASFLTERNLHVEMVRRANQRRGRGLFK